MAKRALGAGFTGDVEEQTGVVAATKSAVSRVRDEAGMVAAHAVDHPAVTGSALAAVGLLAFAVGYVMGA
ncbi:hypothetical protein E2F50_14980 [Rhizobium deserti]|uniref:Uncharacterized protein n=1 Tax=Rhizobium deserti TaxID=2547961 RepID=A0A4R5UHU4_9HYPH|nr:hypothetical protein [Rhizobium deserti]TDK35533.1 hypothetical protein E2F50_14980 [Rhizobium deserti]